MSSSPSSSTKRGSFLSKSVSLELKDIGFFARARISLLCGDCPLWKLRCLKENGTHLLASHNRHLGGPTEERFRCAPVGAHFKRCPLVEIPRFRCRQQPKLRELFFC